MMCEVRRNYKTELDKKKQSVGQPEEATVSESL